MALTLNAFYYYNTTNLIMIWRKLFWMLKN